MRTTVSILVALIALAVVIPQNALAAGWGGGVSVPGWGAFDPGHRGSPHWGGYGYGYGSGSYSHPYVARYYWVQPPLAAPQVAHVVNPATNRVSLTFWIDSQQFVLAPGMQQDVSFLPGQTIQFDRGPGLGLARYSLEGTSFTFTPTPAGWELYRTLPEALPSIASGNPPVPGATGQTVQPTLPAASAPRPIQR